MLICVCNLLPWCKMMKHCYCWPYKKIMGGCKSAFACSFCCIRNCSPASFRKFPRICSSYRV
ncbi:hypothetical protein M8C21_015544 [Ambrosia artemisiifolia]|uniref:Uncharacterized protein n=1 Tax=Ambrosia artemisiifolia TaxID=4212 RepID=A0AAD5GRY2_AMBAR|nr:hypothetical protein M8C21_015544 [Ambrosia artemisiifolia]